MIILKRIPLNSRCVAHFISTSSVCNEKKPVSKIFSILNEKEKEEREVKKKVPPYPEKIVSEEDKNKAKQALNLLLNDLDVETEAKQREKTDPEAQAKEAEDKNLLNFLSQRIKNKEARKNVKKNLSELLSDAAGEVAKDLGGDKEKIKTDLLDHLKTIDVQQEDEPSESTSPIPSTVKIQLKKEDLTRELQSVLSQERLEIFTKTNIAEMSGGVKLNIWDKLEEEELRFMAEKPPNNQFEEWILWTKQGKLWHFPIDNDQGMEKEAKVDFTQHVFLEQHLDPWCPKKGPLKKFMDLVIIGLGKNPYLTVEEKKEHIFWYRDYFEKKKKLLQELGAFGSVKEIGKPAVQEEA